MMDKIYTCNVCGNKIKDVVKCFGVLFESPQKFYFSAYSATDVCHICFSCASQLKENLKDCEVEGVK